MVKIHYPQEPHILGWLRNFILPTDRIFDVGSGDGRHRDIGGAGYRSLDSWPAAEPDYLIDLNRDDLPSDLPNVLRFDVVLMIDLLEHLPKDRAVEILVQAQRIAQRAVVVLTPLTWDENRMAYGDGFYQGNENILHKSLWDLRDFWPGWTRVWLPSTQDVFFGYWVKQ